MASTHRVAMVSILLGLTLILAMGGTAQPRAVAESPPTFANPVGGETIPNFADPTMIRGRDGYWYAYATGDPLFPGDHYRKLMIARSADLVQWEYVDDVFTEQTEPRYDGLGDGANRLYWAPDIEYVDGRYLLYYSYVVNAGDDRHWRAIGVATAAAPEGPWTDSGAYVTGPETWEPVPGTEAWRNVIDPEVVATPDGTRYLYYGSVDGGVRVVPLSADGLTAVGEPVQVTLENRYEAAHLVHRDGYYYLFLSAIGGCCAGPASGYPVQVGRARTPLGPFLDRDGHSVLGRHAGGTPVQVPTGNRWVSVGHNTLATDLAGQPRLVTHAIDRHNPYLQGTLSRRQLVISRLDWVDGWPTTNGGRGLLDGPQPAPSLIATTADAFEDGALSPRVWQPAPGWTVDREPAGGFLSSPPGRQSLDAARLTRGDVRLRGAVRHGDDRRGSAGLSFTRGDLSVEAMIDRDAESFVILVRRDGTVLERRAEPLPAGFRYDDWHELDVRIRGRQLEATVTDHGLDDPLATAGLSLPPASGGGRLGLLSDQAAADFDDLTAAPLYTPVTTKLPDPAVGPALPGAGDEFDHGLGSGWQPLRDPAAEVRDGRLTLPVQEATELIDQRPVADDGAALLLRQPPAGDWTVETRVTVPYGEGYPGAWPQAGLIARTDDDHFVNLTYAAARRTRHVTFGKELPWDGRVVYGDARLGPTTGDTVWLRLRHEVDPATGEHRYQAAVSVDGDHWVWHGVRTLPAGPSPQLGLAAFGAAPGAGLTATFDYVRFLES
ncbi:family 43 glycosylhydrolase [Microlunatus sp. GCM10028923]|uniref:family 43 glycosylhydrolase n=1 Tax=Microlunatus sp. GCM10028923 TaxID=3273400 RepID=UPI00360CD918